MGLTINSKYLWLFMIVSVLTLLIMVTLPPDADAVPNYFDSDCSICHGPTALVPYPNSTCAGCHRHGGNSTILSATPDSASYAPGDTISVSIEGGGSPTQSGWVRVQMWDLDCSVASTCTQANVLVSESLHTSGTTVNFPGPVTITATAPSTPGDYTWYAGWYGNDVRTRSNSNLFIPDAGNPNHGNELVAFNFTVGAPPETICDDSLDNNNNGLTDCEDPDCSGATFGACDTGNPGECSAGTLTCDGSAVAPVCLQDQAAGTEGPAGDPSCSDGLDNDCDSLLDESDPDCLLQAETCDNGIDDNGDGLIDCEDPLCDGFTGQPGSCDTGQQGLCASGTFTCSNGAADCIQDNTSQTEGPGGDPSCSDSIDNDCDGLTDAADPGCDSLAVETICDDSIDNNTNGLTDCEDPGCLDETFGACDTGLLGICAEGTLTCDGSAATPVCEQSQVAVTEGPTGDPSCTDGLDNDCDGLLDAEDPGCGSAGETIPPGTDVQVTPAAGIELTFAEITSEGVITLSDATSPTAPANYRIIGTVIDLDFTGTFTGPVTVCFAYDETGVVGIENNLKLFHRDLGGQWQDVTTSIDTLNNIICGEISAFSEFAVAELIAADDDNCFIATAAYGSIWEDQVVTLREFRNKFLLTNTLGHKFVAAYYKYSPALAGYIADHQVMRSIARVGLAPLVGFSWLALNFGMMPALLLLTFVLTLITGISCLLITRKN